jgi:hypothetical protein
MQCLSLILVILLSASSVWAQDNYYIRFTDKNNNRYSTDHPDAYLSPRSIARREAQHIAISISDLPLTGSYVNAILPLADRLVYRLKWDNAILVKSGDPAFAAKVSQLPFVKSISKISGQGSSTVQKKLSFGTPRGLQSAPFDTSFYGAAKNQNVMIDVNALHQMGLWGDGMLIAVMDAGFPNLPVDSFFTQVFSQNRVLHTWNYVFDTSFVYAYDEHGAQTFSDIAAYRPCVMVGTAPNAQFLLFITEDVRSEKIIEEYNWANAAEVADSIGADVFSTSLGYTTFDPVDSMYNTTYASLNGDSTPVAKAANLAASKGILVITSAGNDGDDSWHSIATPADADSGVAVGAVNAQGAIGYFSSWGPNSAGVLKPDVCAQGVSSAVVLSNGVLSTNSGTSFACPITAGAFACLREAFPNVSNTAIINAVRQSANMHSNPNDDYGYGIPDFGLAYEYLAALYPTDTTASPTALVYPNPFTTSLNIVIPGILNAPMSYELFDLLGQKVCSGSFAAGTYANNLLSVTPPASLPVGSYILRINGSTCIRLVKRF